MKLTLSLMVTLTIVAAVTIVLAEEVEEEEAGAKLLKSSSGVKGGVDPDDSKVVGGITAGEGQFPYQVSLRSRANRHFCGGSIINELWILTAAHCVTRQSAYSILVVTGTNYLNGGGTPHAVAQVISHPAYSSSNNINDVALIRLATPLQFNDRVRPIQLARSAPNAGSQATLSGWGLLRFPSQQLPNALQRISLRTITVQKCKSALPGFPVFNTHVCTYNGLGQGACQGDSGGPLVVGGQQVGVVSWGIPCARGRPDVFTSVAAYRDWIARYAGSL